MILLNEALRFYLLKRHLYKIPAKAGISFLLIPKIIVVIVILKSKEIVSSKR